MTHRAKTLNSFLGKIQRKKYDDLFSEIEDFAGVRVVCLYISDLPKIGKIVESEFEVVERIDKFRDKAPDQFGYGAIHYVVRLGASSLGARYDDLKTLKCEIQVRTVLQDAWAIIDHHLVYKRESDIPTHIQRKLNGLAGLLETADDQFDRIREERQDYLKDLQKSATDDSSFLSAEINRDSFAAFVERKFPSRPPEGFEGQFNIVLNCINRGKYKILQDLDSAIEPVLSHENRIVSSVNFKDGSDSGAARLLLLLSVVDKQLWDSPGYPTKWITPVAKLAMELSLEKPKLAKRSSRPTKPRQDKEGETEG